MEIVYTILGSAGLFSLIQYLITRRDARTKMLEAIKKEIDEIKADRLLDKATDARRRILRSSDEVLQGMKHSQEWWEQVMDDVTYYEKYCADHKGYENNKARIAIKELTKCYEERREKHDFLI